MPRDEREGVGTVCGDHDRNEPWGAGWRVGTKWRGAVIALIAALLGAGVTLSALAESFLLENGIFGFVHAVDAPLFFAFMMALSVTVTVLLHFFRSQLERWVANLRRGSTVEVGKLRSIGKKQ